MKCNFFLLSVDSDQLIDQWSVACCSFTNCLLLDDLLNRWADIIQPFDRMRLAHRLDNLWPAFSTDGWEEDSILAFVSPAPHLLTLQPAWLISLWIISVLIEWSPNSLERVFLRCTLEWKGYLRTSLSLSLPLSVYGFFHFSICTLFYSSWLEIGRCYAWINSTTIMSHIVLTHREDRAHGM